MKHLFDALRALFAHTPRDFRDSHALLQSLAYLERKLRGFSNRLDILCGPKALTKSDQHLQANLREALADTIRFLSQDFARFEEAKRCGISGEAYEVPAGLDTLLNLKDSSGYLRTTAFGCLRRISEWKRYADCGQYRIRVEPETLTLDAGTLTIHYRVSLQGDDPSLRHEYLSEPLRMGSIDLDSLGGAAMALLRTQRHLREYQDAAPTSPELRTYLESHRKKGEQDAARDRRIRAALASLCAEDRAYLRSQANGMTPSSLRAYFT